MKKHNSEDADQNEYWCDWRQAYKDLLQLGWIIARATEPKYWLRIVSLGISLIARVFYQKPNGFACLITVKIYFDLFHWT